MDDIVIDISINNIKYVDIILSDNYISFIILNNNQKFKIPYENYKEFFKSHPYFYGYILNDTFKVIDKKIRYFKLNKIL